MTKLMNNRWQSRAALALLVAMTLAGCGRRDDLDGNNGGGGGGNGGNGQNNPTDTFALTSNNRLVTFSRTSPAIKTAVNITGLPMGETFLGFDVRPADGTLVGLTSAGRLFRINTDGTTSLLSALSKANAADPFAGLTGTSFGINFNPVPDRLRVVSNMGQNLRIAVDNGAVTTDSALSGVPATATVTAAAYTNSFPSACRTTLYYIDTTANQLLTTTDPNGGVLTPVANLAVNGATVTGFEVVANTDGTNTALVVLTASGTSTLMNVNLNNGTLSNSQPVTGLSAGETLTAISMAPPNGTPPQALGDLVAVTQTNRLISFNAGAPQKLCTPATRVTGLQSGDNILGIDTRPADGRLYAVGSTGRLYTISTAAGMNFAVANMGPMLTAMNGQQFSGLNGNDFGVDFNPTNDRLRVVSNTGQNLRIDVDAGTVTTDTRINPGNPSSTAAAYSNNVAGAGSTTLYVIDTASDQLFIQGAPPSVPNNGDLTLVGTLSTPDVIGSNGFDISGRNGNAVAALTLASSNNQSDLFTVNLTSGLATRVTPVSTIGGGERIRGLAFATPPAPMLMAVTSDNQLITFAPTTPDTIVDSVAISGLQGGESVVAMQVQPDGKLQITTDAQRSFTLNATTGEATLMANANVQVGKRTLSASVSANVRFSATASSDNGLSFGAATNGLGQSRLFTIDGSGKPTAVGMIGPSGTTAVRAMTIRFN